MTWPQHPRTTVAILALGLGLVVGGGLLVGGAWSTLPADALPRVVAELPVTPMDLTLAPANNSPRFAADPTDPRFVVVANRMDAPTFDCALQVSGDGGRRWGPATPVPELPDGADTCYGPEVAFGPDGILYYLLVGLAGEGNQPMGVFLATSADRAATFTPPRQVLGPSNFSVRMAIDADTGEAGRLHLVWLRARTEPPLGGFGPPPNPVMAAYSDDGGVTFSDPVQVSDPARERVVAPALALGPDQRVEVAYYDLGEDIRDYQGLEGPTWEGNWSVIVASSGDGGQHFGVDRVVDDAVKPARRVMLIFTMPPPALVAWQDRTCVAWTDARFGDADALITCADGASWPAPRRLNDDPVSNGLSQYLPQLAVSPDGGLDALFYDRRRDPLNLGTFVSLVHSDDGGRTFDANVSVTEEPFNPRIGQQYGVVSAKGQVEFGSRLGLLSRSDDVLSAWADTRNADPATTAQDLMVAEIDLPQARDHGRGAGVAMVVGGGGLATAGFVIQVRRCRRRPRAPSSPATEEGAAP